MTRRKLTDVLPPLDFTADTASAVTSNGLSFTATDETGTETLLVSLARLPGALQLRVDLLTGIRTMNGARGNWRSIYTVRAGFNTTSSFLRWLDDEGLCPESVRDIDVPTWNRWLLRTGSTAAANIVIGHMRSILSSAPGTSPELIQAMTRRRGKAPIGIQESYTEDQFRLIRRQARKVIHAASRRIAANYQVLLQRQAGTTLDQSLRLKGDALLELFQTGGSDTAAHYKILGATSRRSQRQVANLRKNLFITSQEAWAAGVLLAAEAGWNKSVIDRLVVPDGSTGAGESTAVYTVELYKPRRGVSGQHSTSTELAASDVGRALRWIITATEPAREALAAVGCPTNRLLVYGAYRSLERTTTPLSLQLGFPPYTAGRARSGHIALPPPLASASTQKLRRTRQVIFDRTPTQNTRRTHEDTYVRNDTATHESARGVIETGLSNALSQADTIVKMQLLAEEEVDDAIRRGEGDTAFAACADFDHHPSTGTICRDSFLACLACSNAIATPRHLPRIVLLHDALEELSSALNVDEWRQRWEAHYVRLTTLLEQHTTDAERCAARRIATAADRTTIARLLTGGYSAE